MLKAKNFQQFLNIPQHIFNMIKRPINPLRKRIFGHFQLFNRPYYYYYNIEYTIGGKKFFFLIFFEKGLKAMKFQCNRQKLNKAVENLQRVTASKTTIPALEGILLKAEKNKLTLCGYDLDIGITTSIDTNIKTEGSVVVPAKLFSDIIKRMPEDIISIETDEKLIIYISGGKAEYKIIGMSAEEYPELPAVASSEKIAIDGKTLKSMIRQTMYAVSDKDENPTQKGSLFEIANGTFRIVSVDGYRLAIRTEKANFDGEKSIIVPRKSLQEIINLISDDVENVVIRAGGRHLTMLIGDYTIITRLIEGEFMNYKATIPSVSTTEAVINTRMFSDTIERMSLLLTDRIKTPIKCCFENNTVTTSCNTSKGEATDEFEADITGSYVEIGLDNKYILDALKFAETDEVKIKMNGSLKPIVVLPSEGDNFIFLVMPVRLKNG